MNVNRKEVSFSPYSMLGNVNTMKKRGDISKEMFSRSLKIQIQIWKWRRKEKHKKVKVGRKVAVQAKAYVPYSMRTLYAEKFWRR